MNLCRVTHPEEIDNGVPVVMEVSHLKKLTVDLLYSFIEMWLWKNCKSPWKLEQIEDLRVEDHRNHIYFRIFFSDVREAIYFKLSPFTLHDSPQLLMLMNFCTNMQ